MGQEPSGPSSHAGTLPLHGAWREAGERWDVAEAPSSGGPSHYGWTRLPENGPGGGPLCRAGLAPRAGAAARTASALNQKWSGGSQSGPTVLRTFPSQAHLAALGSRQSCSALV